MTRTRRCGCGCRLGPDAVRRIREKLQDQLVDLNTWESVAVATGYPAT
ncbi:MAG: hypothetical protein ACRDRK_22460 [Pseudonocardia sp.]